MKVGDRIQCWTSQECTHKMMELASKGILTKEDKFQRNCLIVEEIQDEEENDGITEKH